MDNHERINMNANFSSLYYMQRETGNGSQFPSGPVPIRFIPNPVSQYRPSFYPVPVQQQLAEPVPVNAGTGTVKKKRGRPRKYVSSSEGSVGLNLSQNYGSAPQKVRGRPPGTGTKLELFPFGEWIAGSAGMGFTPHVITLSAGSDISSKIMSFSHGPRAICVLSAIGSVSKVTLRRPSNPAFVTYEGRFEILSLRGSIMMSETESGARVRTGGLSVSLSNSDGRVFGGSLAGLLIADSPIQLIVGSFVHPGAKEKSKEKESEQVTPVNSHLDLSETNLNQAI